MAIPPRRLAEELRALADTLDGAGDLAGNVMQVRLSCSSDAELERLGGSLGAEVSALSGIRGFRRQFGPLWLTVLVEHLAPSPGEGRAMTMAEARQGASGRAAESAGTAGNWS